MTNFEKIKDMSLEELAAKCCGSSYCSTCPIWDFCIHIHTMMHNGDRQVSDCLTTWKEWLKSEVEE